MDSDFVNYFGDRRSGPQWKAFLQNLANELVNVGTDGELHALAQRAGARFAEAHPLPPCETLDDIGNAMREAWTAIDWGWVDLFEQEDHLQIVHHCSPLVAGFGEQHAGWAVGYLEGAYQHWFSAIDPDSALRVRAEAPLDPLGSVALRLGA